MFGWVKGLFSGKASRPVESSEAPDQRLEAKAAPAGKMAVNLAEWSGLAMTPQKKLDPKEREQAVELLAHIRAHFRAHKPPPSSFPALAAKVIDLVEQPSLDVNKLVHTISQDSAISAKILQVANSAAYARSASVEDLRAAVMVLGLREVANIAVGVAGRSLFDMEARAEFDMFAKHWNRLYQQSMTTAFAAGALALDRRLRSDHAFLSGMLHDVGKSIALRSLSGLMMTGKVTEPPSDAVVERLLDALHIELGYDMHTTWNLPAFCTQICQRHHEEEIDPKEVLLHVVRLTSGLSLLRGAYRETLARQVRQSIVALGITPRAGRSLGTQIEEFSDRVAIMFDIPIDPDLPAKKAAP